MNPLLSNEKNFPNYKNIEPERIYPTITKLLDEAKEKIQLLINTIETPTWENFFLPLEEVMEDINYSWNIIEHLNNVQNNSFFREEYNKLLPIVSKFWSNICHNTSLYEKYKFIQNDIEFDQLSIAKKKIINNAIKDFLLSGVSLSEKKKLTFSKIKERQAILSQIFSDNVLDSTDSFIYTTNNFEEINEMPNEYIETAKRLSDEKSLDGWSFTLHIPSYLPAQQYASRSFRKKLYQAYTTRASELGHRYAMGKIEWNNQHISLEQLRLRNEEANMLGYSNYASLSLTNKMAKDPKQVNDFLINFINRVRPFALRDWNELCEFSETFFKIDKLEPWDILYFSEKLKQEKYSISEQEIKQYFLFPKVLNGLFEITKELFNITIERSDLPVWHHTVQSFQLVNELGEIIAYFYIDPYARPGKRSGAWMDEVRGRKILKNGSIQTPVACLICNFPAPVTINGSIQPNTISHEDVMTLFHEFGHGLHHMLTQVNELGVSGIHGVEWDAVELPSQFMENFCWEWEILQRITSHIKTNEPLPRSIFDKMILSKNFQSGLKNLKQLILSLTDLYLHIDSKIDYTDQDAILKCSQSISNEFDVIYQSSISRWPYSFSHIFSGGYAAGYYSYKWAEVLSADIYSFFQEGRSDRSILNPSIGKRYLKEILSVGGSRSMKESFIAFCGREPKIDSLLKNYSLL